MMNNIILKYIEGERKAAWRITTDWIEKRFKFRCIIYIDDLEMYNNKKIDIILVPYGFNIASNLQAKIQFVLNHQEARWVYFKNDYNLPVPTWFKEVVRKTGKKWELIYNCETREKIPDSDWFSVVHPININCLIHRNYNIDQSKERKHDLIYWGMFRKDRIDYYKRYFDENIYVSTSKQNVLAYKNCLTQNRFPKFIEPIYLRGAKSELLDFKYSLYIEDPYSHIFYTCPANRYYEALNYGAIQLFDVNCLHTFNTYGINIEPFVIENRDGLKKKMEEINKNREKFWKIQEKWREKADEDLIDAEKKFKEIFE